MNFRSRTSILAALALGLTLHAASSRADIFNWDNLTYAPANATAAAGTINVGNSTNGGNSLSVKMVLSTGASFYNAGGLTSPVDSSYGANNTYASGGGADAKKSLQIATGFTTNAAFVTVTLLFTQPVVSASFSFFDVDAGTVNGGGYNDQIRTIQGLSTTGTTVTPTTLTKVNGGTTTTPTTTTTVTANGTTNAQNSNLGNVTVTFNSTDSLTQISFIYGDTYAIPNGGSHSAIQIIGVSDITFTPVPEPGTAALVSLGLAGLAGTVFRRRR